MTARPISTLLPALNGLRVTGAGRWVARCPAHEDQNPSLSVRELDDGRVLMHCFAGCDVGTVTAAIGLEVSDLFPERRDHRQRVPRSGIHPIDALHCLAHEARVVLVAASDLACGRAVSEQDEERFRLAVSRIQLVLGAFHV